MSVRILLVFLLCATGGLILWFATSQGLGVSSDSDMYIGGARHIARREGYTLPSADGKSMDPIDTFPPGYSTLLAIPYALGCDMMQSARWLHIFLMAFNVGLIGLMIFSYSKSVWASIIGGVVIVLGIDILNLHAYVWSEASFIFFGFLGTYLLSLYLKEGRYIFLVAASGCSAYAFFTRYAGLPFVLATSASVLFFEKKSLVRRGLDTGLALFIGFLPMVLFVLRNWLLCRNVSDRHWSFHPPALPHLYDVLRTILLWVTQKNWAFSWLFSKNLEIGIAALALVLLGTAVLASGIEFKKIERCPGLWIQFLFVIFYGWMLLIVNTFFQADLLLESERIMAPLHVSILIIVMTAAPFVFCQLRYFSRISLSMAGIAWLLFYGYRGIRWAEQLHQGVALDYYAETWRRSELIECVRQLPGNTMFYCNIPYPVLFYADRSALDLPQKIALETLKPDPKYLSEFSEFASMLNQHRALLVYFDAPGETDSLSLSEIIKEVPLQCLRKVSDGGIYAAR